MSAGRPLLPQTPFQRAFSLIELLVSIGIISLLLALILPSLSLARKQADRLRCASHLRSFGDACTLYRSTWGHYPQVDGPPRVAGLSSIGKIAQELVKGSLGDPRAFYCPTSLENDPCARGPFTRSGSIVVENWKSSPISYMYLPGVVSSYPAADGTPTFNPQRETPDHPRNVKAVLAGDRTVDLGTLRNVEGSNHGREGGWFYFVAGNVQWWDFPRLTAHPIPKKYTWYWPRTAAPQSPAP